MDTPFPFPWAQAVTITLLLFCISAPFLVVSFTTNVYLAAGMTAVTVHTYMMLNEARLAASALLHLQRRTCLTWQHAGRAALRCAANALPLNPHRHL